MRKLFIVVNVDWFFLSHRKEIALAAQNEGFDVTIVTSNTGRVDEIVKLGLKWIDFPIKRSSVNIFSEIGTILFLVRLYKKHKPDIVHHVSLKVSLYGTIAAYFTKIKAVVNAISGLGFAVSSGEGKFVGKMFSLLTKFILNLHKNQYFIFQNNDDANYFKSLNLLNENNNIMLNGSGVDLNWYNSTRIADRNIIKILFSGRILREKGVYEFINAAKLLRDKYSDKVKFIIAGSIDLENKTAITKTDLDKLLVSDYIEYIGFRKDMVSILQDSDIVVLPSYYREGIPKALIEACAIGRPIVTTNWVGCRECVVDGENGFLVPIKDEKTLAQKIEILINDANLRVVMGLKSRNLAENKFSVTKVIDGTLSLYYKSLK